MNLIYYINSALQNNETCIAIFIDLTKAFDLVNLDILIAKLYKYGVRRDVLTFSSLILEIVKRELKSTIVSLIP